MQPEIEQQVIRLALDCLAREGSPLRTVQRMIDLEAHLRSCEEGAGRMAEDRFQEFVKGKYAVHIAIPDIEPGVAMDPNVLIVTVDLINQSASILQGL